MIFFLAFFFSFDYRYLPPCLKVEALKLGICWTLIRAIVSYPDYGHLSGNRVKDAPDLFPTVCAIICAITGALARVLPHQIPGLDSIRVGALQKFAIASLGTGPACNRSSP
jgi:hypothetical protein